MKKKYIKPMLSKESFSVTESVAAGCGGLRGAHTNAGSPDSCYFQVGNDTKFFYSSSACESMDVDESVYCYQGMSDSALAVFNS